MAYVYEIIDEEKDSKNISLFLAAVSTGLTMFGVVKKW